MKFKPKLLVGISELHSLSEDGVVIFCLIQAIFRNESFEHNYFSINQLSFYYGSSRGDINHLKSGVKELLENGIATKKSRDIYDITSDKFEYKKHFVMIDAEVLPIIMKAGAFRHYCFLLYNIVSTYKTGKRTIEYFADQEGVSPRTIMRHNKILEEKKLIYFYETKFNKKEQRNEVMTYCKYGDEDPIWFAYPHDSNWRRSVTARYNRYRKNPASYSPDKIKQLKSDCEQYNKEQTDEEMKKDLTIFEKNAIMKLE